MIATDRLRRLAEVAPLLGADGEWLAEALARYLAEAPDGLTLDAACGVARDPGRDPWWRTEARRRRDDAIRAMARLHFAGMSTHRAAIAITEAARRYEATSWRRDRTFTAPPAAYTGTIRALLWHALATGQRFPSGWRQVWDILDGGNLQSNTGVSLQFGPVMLDSSE